jgi:hypothetical protein
MIIRGRFVTPNIDRLILSFVETRWLKVARIVSDVCMAPEKQGGTFNEDEVGARVEALVAAGQLESQGDLKRWRYSEVRLPAKNST